MYFDTRTIIRNIIVSLVGIGLVVLVIVLLVRSFSGGTEAPTGRIDVGDYANSSSTATLLVDGPTRLNQEHYQVRITVSGIQNEIQIIQGYQGDVVRSQTYANNTAAYAAFLQSLQLLNFSRGIESDVDYRGYCPTGSRYLYSFSNNQNELFKYWGTSCGSQGTFRGDGKTVRELFQRQISQQDLGDLMRGTGINF